MAAAFSLSRFLFSRGLKSGLIRLYHQTSKAAAAKFLSSGMMKAGWWGYAGPGMSFAETPEETCLKALHKRVVLECEVDLGKVKTITSPANWSSPISRWLYGYDSIKVAGRSSGVEYVVYNPNQIKNIAVVPEAFAFPVWLQVAGIALVLYGGAWYFFPDTMCRWHRAAIDTIAAGYRKTVDAAAAVYRKTTDAIVAVFRKSVATLTVFFRKFF